MSNDKLVLEKSFNASGRQRKISAFLLVAPLLIFITFSFILPIGSMLLRSFYHPTAHDLIPLSAAALENWKATHGSAPEAFYKTFAVEVKNLAEKRESGKLAADINRFEPGTGSLITAIARSLRREDLSQITDFKAYFAEKDPRWIDPEFIFSIKLSSQLYTVHYFVSALDKKIATDGSIVDQDKERQIYRQILIRTVWLACSITLITVFLGYPLAYYLASVRDSVANVLLILVLLPFWTSLLVRTTSWIVLLQTEGVINQILRALGLIDKPLDMLYNEYSTMLAMTHILLPFMVLPLYSVMKGIDPVYMRAASSLGSGGIVNFFKVYLPMSMPGLSAGGLIVFIVSIGYYITPALVGGVKGQMISNLIAFHMQQSNNWELASALGTILLILVLFFFWLYNKLVGIGNLKMG